MLVTVKRNATLLGLGGPRAEAAPKSRRGLSGCLSRCSRRMRERVARRRDVPAPVDGSEEEACRSPSSHHPLAVGDLSVRCRSVDPDRVRLAVDEDPVADRGLGILSSADGVQRRSTSPRCPRPETRQARGRGRRRRVRARRRRRGDGVAGRREVKPSAAPWHPCDGPFGPSRFTTTRSHAFSLRQGDQAAVAWSRTESGDLLGLTETRSGSRIPESCRWTRVTARPGPGGRFGTWVLGSRRRRWRPVGVGRDHAELPSHGAGLDQKKYWTLECSPVQYRPLRPRQRRSLSSLPFSQK